MTRLEELKAAYEAAVAAYDAYDAYAASAWDAVACDDAHNSVWDAYTTARDAYEAELNKTQEENSND
jgi:hypothetical protein